LRDRGHLNYRLDASRQYQHESNVLTTPSFFVFRRCIDLLKIELNSLPLVVDDAGPILSEPRLACFPFLALGKNARSPCERVHRCTRQDVPQRKCPRLNVVRNDHAGELVLVAWVVERRDGATIEQLLREDTPVLVAVRAVLLLRLERLHMLCQHESIHKRTALHASSIRDASVAQRGLSAGGKGW
jgi:hypothetical protein